MTDPRDLIRNNRAWARQMVTDDPDFFRRLEEQQAPRYLWIGCSDSRVPANQITGLAPGEIFVHRNLANVVPHTDLNVLSVLGYAVKVLKVEHIIVCGHYGCGGVAAALDREGHGLLDNWLRHIKDVAARHDAELGRMDASARHTRLTELNVVEQAMNVCTTSIVQAAWAAGQELSVHAWAYSLRNGFVRDLKFKVQGPEDLAPAYRLSMESLPEAEDY